MARAPTAFGLLEGESQSVRKGENPYHVTPSWDMKKLYVDNKASSSLTEIDPKTGKPTE